jgi:FixJ family two-component response regulator
VIVITAVIDLDVARRTLHDGATNVISKPFVFSEVRAIVDAAVAARGR